MATKNTMLPIYEGNQQDMYGAIKQGRITGPCWMWLEDKECLAFIHWETIGGEKVLTPHIILMDRVNALEEKLESMDKAVGDIADIIPSDPDTGEAKNLVEYLVSVSSQVNEVSNSISMITAKDLLNEDNPEESEVTE